MLVRQKLVAPVRRGSPGGSGRSRTTSIWIPTVVLALVGNSKPTVIELRGLRNRTQARFTP
jgi:hypothetical protein